MPATQKEETGFHGCRYLVDTTNSRQYAVRFNNGKPQPPIGVFAGKPEESGLKPNETVFALDDEFELDTNSKGARITTSAFQIKVGSDGNPKGLKISEVSYDLKFLLTKKDLQVSFEMSDASKVKLADMDYDPAFPRTFSTSLDLNSHGITRQGGSVLVAPQLIRSIAFPPHQDGGALIARMYLEGSQAPAAKPEPKPEPKPSRTFKMADEQTLVETKTLDADSKMKFVFNFEARRVSEVYETRGKEPALTGYSFAEVDREALEENHKRLSDMGGKPRPLDEKKGPSLKKAQ